MLENLVDVLIKKVRDEVVTDPNMNDIPLAYIQTRQIPDSVKHFLDQEVELWIREEEEKFNSSDRFDYDMPEVRMLIDQIFDNLKQNARFHINKFNHLIERAIKLEMNYLIEPHRTLTQFIFKDKPVVSTIDIYNTLKYFFKYKYYKDAISDYFNTKYLREISAEQFGQLISQIDENAFKENRLETSLQTIKTLTSFMQEATGEEVETLPLDVLAHVFKDRNLNSYNMLIEEMQDKGFSEITLSNLESILAAESLDPIIAPPDTKEAVESKEETITIDKLEDIEESKPVVEVDGIELGEMQPDEIVSEVEEEEEEDEEEEEETDVVAGPSSTQKPNVADDMANFVASQIQSDKPLEDLNGMISGRTRKKIIKKLFNKKEDEFLNFVRLINDESAWKTASVTINNEFYERGINPYSKEAIMFSDIIYLRFFPKDRYVGEQN